jgi:MFS transporter, DHA2 family, multidrug resistance protein
MQNSTPISTRDPGRWMVLMACIIAVLTVAIDTGVINLVVPSLQKDLNASPTTVGLVSSIATLMLAAFILGGGTLGDLYGRRRFILIGTGGLIATAILSMLTPSAEALIGIRALDGIFQALVNPLALAIISITFDHEERPKALGIYGATLGIIGGFSSLVIQYLNQTFGWRSVFLLVIGLGILTIALMLRFVSESKAGGAKKLDWLGILLCAAGLFGIVFGISQATGPGGIFSSQVLIPLVVGLVIFFGFIWWESRVQFPALELSLFRKPAFSLGVLLVFVFSFAQTSVFFHLSNYFQVLLKVPPLNAALMLMPLTLSLFVFSILSGAIANKFQPRTMIVLGTVIFALAMLGFVWTVKPDLSMGAIAIPMILLGAGMGLANIPRMNALLASAPAALAGSASATNNAITQLGNSMGIAITIVTVTAFARNAYRGELTQAGLTDEKIQSATDLLKQTLTSDADTISSQFALPKEQLEGLVGNYQAAYTTGVAQTMLLIAIALLIAAVVMWFGFRSRSKVNPALMTKGA